MKMSERWLGILAGASVVVWLTAPMAEADEAEVLAKLEEKAGTLRLKKLPSGEVVEVAVNAPGFSNADLALFNEIPHLKRLTISHAGYSKGKKTGVDYSGVALLKDHPSLEYFSAGGAVGKEYLAALPELKNVPELYIQTTHSIDADWAPIGQMIHLEYLGIRVRNDRMSEMTDAFFVHLMPLENLERFFLSEMTFTDPLRFVEFVTSRPNLKELSLRRCNLDEMTLDLIRDQVPGLSIEIRE